MGETSLFNRVFLIVDMCLSWEDIAPQSCAMVPRWPIFGDFLGPAFPASRVQYISDLHSKFVLRPQTSNLRRLRLGEEKTRKKQDKTRMWANAQRDGRPAEHR